MMRLASLVESTSGLVSNFFMGSSMRFSRWRAHWMLPATGGMLRGISGLCLCLAYNVCTSSRSSP
jgi:hypothetical protein